MKIDSFPMVARIMAARKKLIGQRDGGKLVITIDGTNQDFEMVDSCRPAINAVLDRRIAEFDEDLRQLGVQVP